MRKTASLAALFTLFAAAFSFGAQVSEIPFVPVSPVVTAQGGAFISTAQGYQSFFFNPAGYSRGGIEFTLADVSAWVYARPDTLLSTAQSAMAGSFSPTDILGFMSSQVTGGGIGAGASAGIGLTGSGLGLGLIVVVDSLLSGPSLLGLSGDITGTVGFIGGLSVPIDLGIVRIHVGGDIRPMIRIHAPLTNTMALAMLSAISSGGDIVASLNSGSAFYGVGIGLDLGTIVELGPFSFGISIRDLAGTRFQYSSATFGTIVDTFNSTMKLPTGATVTSPEYVIPMNIGMGVGFHPDLGGFKYILDPSLGIDIQDLVGMFQGTRSFWTTLHAGAELKLLTLFAFRGGVNQGYFTLGAGLDLFFLELNMALFTRELGAHVGDRASSGATLNVALRF